MKQSSSTPRKSPRIKFISDVYPSVARLFGNKGLFRFRGMSDRNKIQPPRSRSLRSRRGWFSCNVIFCLFLVRYDGRNSEGFCDIFGVASVLGCCYDSGRKIVGKKSRGWVRVAFGWLIRLIRNFADVTLISILDLRDMYFSSIKYWSGCFFGESAID